MVTPFDRWLMSVLGSKDLYGGKPLLEASNNSIIYVRVNYRVSSSCSVMLTDSSERLGSLRGRPCRAVEA